MCNTHTLYLLRRSGAEPEVFLLYTMGLSVKELFFSLLGEPLFMKKNCVLHIKYNIVYQ